MYVSQQLSRCLYIALDNCFFLRIISCNYEIHKKRKADEAFFINFISMSKYSFRFSFKF